MSPWQLRQIAVKINKGALIAYPTDTIWGFGCHPLRADSVERLQSLKRRSHRKGLILLSSSLDFCAAYIDDSQFRNHYEILARPLSNPVTWLVKARQDCPSSLTGSTGMIAIRITHKPLLAQLCNFLQSPLVSTSANFSGKTTARNSLLVHRHFKSRVDIIIEGFTTDCQQPSEIRVLETGEILRS